MAKKESKRLTVWLRRLRRLFSTLSTVQWSIQFNIIDGKSCSLLTMSGMFLRWGLYGGTVIPVSKGVHCAANLKMADSIGVGWARFYQPWSTLLPILEHVFVNLGARFFQYWINSEHERTRVAETGWPREWPDHG